eukprot:CAMPEP_0185796724 /NCGR_PEP_ID=MMETSP1174-20130828/161238_1 /TAXON_ID=35687 /ORGANISM="Dictyocha speculum, Strain CCMP1381" /LENGTH=93 /DNA_ID=CAMNT_0028492115 /DNA_START=1477 /DNA_END=1754 /DNA_ORIENTATION=+
MACARRRCGAPDPICDGCKPFTRSASPRGSGAPAAATAAAGDTACDTATLQPNQMEGAAEADPDARTVAAQAEDSPLRTLRDLDPVGPITPTR